MRSGPCGLLPDAHDGTSELAVGIKDAADGSDGRIEPVVMSLEPEPELGPGPMLWPQPVSTTQPATRKIHRPAIMSPPPGAAPAARHVPPRTQDESLAG